ncbi:DeoR/GlpR family DNA-binding transcription regulator [Vagococcus vulneris]|uniref:DeoR family transcriptional regulator n=1 Tax=Vagococcus vulneris TaxID=1977869 RepID=A0A429ZRU0_9ENTE|nr:DeoR/GlpR family DNA-binding transcription regulator [Vagococcus vulneris]RST96387.1 DeoR family transcriptional regulator [Vagococcus vulneris]
MKAKRSELIKEYIIDKQHVSLKELEKEFGVSMNTIRRDINKILEDPRFEKVYGGVSVKENNIISFENRNIKNKDIKKEIAKHAASLIEDDDLIYIDSGTTTKYILDYLDEDITITILTNNLDVIIKSENFKNVSIFILGNIFKKKTRSFVGIDPEELINRYNVSKAFMAATAVSTTHSGLMNSDIMEYEIKKHITEISTDIYLLVDHTKFDKSTLFTYAPLDIVDKMITDKNFSEKDSQFFNDKQIDIIKVNNDLH